ncbi:hypothetical protein [Brachybacterium saurashtrense]|uniref:hypothetical protein n=1 Tax=Brachybacterium saurashtrense TaxID=556288 RepID=UPI001F493927|nr:hypothetical protein [Brachybacterium saurashtrense]
MSLFPQVLDVVVREDGCTGRAVRGDEPDVATQGAEAFLTQFVGNAVARTSGDLGVDALTPRAYAAESGVAELRAYQLGLLISVRERDGTISTTPSSAATTSTIVIDVASNLDMCPRCVTW